MLRLTNMDAAMSTLKCGARPYQTNWANGQRRRHVLCSSIPPSSWSARVQFILCLNQSALALRTVLNTQLEYSLWVPSLPPANLVQEKRSPLVSSGFLQPCQSAFVPPQKRRNRSYLRPRYSLSDSVPLSSLPNLIHQVTPRHSSTSRQRRGRPSYCRCAHT